MIKQSSDYNKTNPMRIFFKLFMDIYLECKRHLQKRVI